MKCTHGISIRKYCNKCASEDEFESCQDSTCAFYSIGRTFCCSFVNAEGKKRFQELGKRCKGA